MIKKILLLMVCVFMLMAVPVVADDEYEAGMTDSFIDSLGEDISLAFTFNKAKRAEKAFAIAQEKLAEFEELAGDGDFKAAEKAKLRHDKFLAKFEAEFESTTDESDEEGYQRQIDFETRIQQHKERVDAFIAELEEDGELTDAQKEKIANYISALGERVDQAEAKVKSRADKSRDRLKARLSNTEIDGLEGDRYAHLAIVAQNQAKREILKAEKKIAEIELREKRKAGSDDETDYKKEKREIQENFRDQIKKLPEDSPLLLENCIEKLKEEYEDISDAAAKEQCKDLGRTKDRSGRNLLTGRVVDAAGVEINDTNSTDNETEEEPECTGNTDCEEGFYCASNGECEITINTNITTNETETDSCSNGIQDEDEDGIDCGDVCYLACEEELDCTTDDDCDSDEYCSDEGECEDVVDSNSTNNETNSTDDDADEEEEEEEYEDSVMCDEALFDRDGRGLDVAKGFLADAKETFKQSVEAFRAEEYRAAYGHAKCAKKLANAAMKGKYLQESDDDDSNDDDADEEEEYECTTDADCDSDEYCSDENECEDVEDEAECSEDSDCGDGYYCDDDECEDVEVEEVDCTTDADCDGDEFCSDSNECEDVEDINSTTDDI